MLVLYLCVLIVFSLRRESLKLILVDEPLPEFLLSHSARCSFNMGNGKSWWAQPDEWAGVNGLLALLCW
jgi:hypothetical protein